MNIAIDTNRYSDLARGDPAVLAFLGRVEKIAVPFVVLAELRLAFASGTRSRENERGLRRFLAKRGVDVLWPTDATTRVYAAIQRRLKQKGTPIPQNDAWIAALAVENGLPLYTRDSDFARVEQLDVV